MCGCGVRGHIVLYEECTEEQQLYAGWMEKWSVREGACEYTRRSSSLELVVAVVILLSLLVVIQYNKQKTCSLLGGMGKAWVACVRGVFEL